MFFKQETAEAAKVMNMITTKYVKPWEIVQES